MIWGSYGIVHILTLVLAVVMNVILYFILKKCSKTAQITVLFILSLTGIAAIIYNLVMWHAPLEYLPFHLCSINAMILPFVVLTRNKVLTNLTLLWSLGAACAVILNQGMAEVNVFSHVFAFYFFPHVFETSVPILLFALKLTELKPKCYFSTLGISAGAYTLIHFINLAVNHYAVVNNITYGGEAPIEVNYMFSLFHAHNPALKFFYDLLPYEYWYMLPATLVIATVYLGAVYGIHALIKRKKKA